MGFLKKIPPVLIAGWGSILILFIYVGPTFSMTKNLSDDKREKSTKTMLKIPTAETPNDADTITVQSDNKRFFLVKPVEKNVYPFRAIPIEVKSPEFNKFRIRVNAEVDFSKNLFVRDSSMRRKLTIHPFLDLGFRLKKRREFPVNLRIEVFNDTAPAHADFERSILLNYPHEIQTMTQNILPDNNKSEPNKLDSERTYIMQ